MLYLLPAAFRRLCVETRIWREKLQKWIPAAFRRLCVETKLGNTHLRTTLPAAFRRLCVETSLPVFSHKSYPNQPPSGGCVLKPALYHRLLLSMLPAAFRRLCVETISLNLNWMSYLTSRLQAAVC